jgi:hypothetical protein
MKTMDGFEYVNLIAHYIKHNYSNRGLQIYREIAIGKTIIGKNRRIDILDINEKNKKAIAIECKYQEVQGTVDEKIPYAINDICKLPMKGGIVYAGAGFSQGVLHLLESSPYAVYCLPSLTLEKCSKTRELDHLLALYFKWWDVIVDKKAPL